MMLDLSFAECEKAERDHGSPFYLFDRETFVRNFRSLEHAFRARYPKVRIGYSYKTNYLPYLCRIVKDLGGYAEVVSRLEYDLALRLGHAPSTIIFNGPLKRREDIELALSGGALVHLDSEQELEHVRAFMERHPGSAARVGVRVNVNLDDAQGGFQLQDGLSVGRFGVPPESLARIASSLARLGLRVCSLHGHTSSASRGTWVYQRITETLCRVAEELPPDTIEEIDVGGGFFGPMPAGFAPPGAPSFEAYAEAIVGILERSAWARRREPLLVLEPGVSVVADALSYFTRVVDVKDLRGHVFAIVDGSILHVKPSMHRRNQPHRAIHGVGARASGERTVSVVGATCMEKDCLLRDVVSDLFRGDFLRIDNVGAYSIVMSPPFIHPAPAIVTRDGARMVAVRKRETFEHVFENYQME